jgi:hypothetical protein
VGDDVPVNSETLLIIDFVNLKIKPVQSFRVTHKDRMCIYIFIGMSANTYINIYIFTVFIKKITNSKLLESVATIQTPEVTYPGIPIHPHLPHPPLHRPLCIITEAEAGTWRVL